MAYKITDHTQSFNDDHISNLEEKAVFSPFFQM